MTFPRHCAAWLTTILTLVGGPILADEGAGKAEEPLPTVAEKTKDLQRLDFEGRDGFLVLHADGRHGQVWLEVPPPTGPRSVALEMLYVESLVTGLGSNPVGLDRGQPGEVRWIRVRRLGPKVLFEQPNLKYRAMSSDPRERHAADESFATSVIWAADVDALDEDGRALVDLTSFLVRDAHDVAGVLKRTEQGEFELDPNRSAVDLDAVLVFPDNVEVDAVLTYGGSEPGDHVRRTAPVPTSLSFVQHHSFVRLPDDGYRPRKADPRMGINSIEHFDYAAPLDQPVSTRWLERHRLVKADPSARRSKAVEPIVFYVDRGAPEPVRSALVEGASWWQEAFEAAGFVDGFRVELLPDGVHPMDARYNVIQWVHRSTRGWSYGTSMSDPRTGEVIKGHVNLGSLRVRQDRLLFEGLAGTAKTGTGDADDPVVLALARIRQLAAHEVGHALGLAHNFAASTYGRGSVMDYPAPLIGVTAGGDLDFSRAYAIGVGPWDIQQIRYAYGQWAPGDETARLADILRDNAERGLLFVADADARRAGASDPRGNLWDNGDDPVEALALALRVRRIALDRFGEANVATGRPLAELEEVLAPVYFHHRYQLDAAVKVLGGMEYSYALRGDGQVSTSIVEGERQRRALETVLGILTPAELDLDDGVLQLLAPRPFEMERNREMFESSTWPAFDVLGAAATAADAVVEAVLEPHRLGRLHDFHRRDASLPGLSEVLDAMKQAAFGSGAEESERQAAIRRIVQRVVVHRWIAAVASPKLRPEVRAYFESALSTLFTELRAQPTLHVEQVGLVSEIKRFLARDVSATLFLEPPSPPPPGSPIGDGLHGCGGNG